MITRFMPWATMWKSGDRQKAFKRANFTLFYVKFFLLHFQAFSFTFQKAENFFGSFFRWNNTN